MIDFNVVWVVLLGIGVPSGIVSVMIRGLEKKLDAQENARQEKEKLRVDLEKKLIDLSMDSLDLAKVTAEAVQRIPDAHCNGEMTQALEKANKTLEAYREEERNQIAKIMVQTT